MQYFPLNFSIKFSKSLMTTKMPNNFLQDFLQVFSNITNKIFSKLFIKWVNLIIDSRVIIKWAHKFLRTTQKSDLSERKMYISLKLDKQPCHHFLASAFSILWSGQSIKYRAITFDFILHTFTSHTLRILTDDRIFLLARK